MQKQRGENRCWDECQALLPPPPPPPAVPPHQ